MMSFQCFHWPRALKSKTNSNICPSTGGRESNFPFNDLGRGNSAVLLPNIISRIPEGTKRVVVNINQKAEYTCIKYSSVILSLQAASNGPDTTVDHGSLGIILFIIISINERYLNPASKILSFLEVGQSLNEQYFKELEAALDEVF